MHLNRHIYTHMRKIYIYKRRVEDGAKSRCGNRQRWRHTLFLDLSSPIQVLQYITIVPLLLGDIRFWNGQARTAIEVCEAPKEEEYWKSEPEVGRIT